MQRHLQKVKRVDIVWDEYHEKSLKNSTRNRRGSGARRRVQANNQLPRNWHQFLRVNGNKKELFTFHRESLEALKVPQNKQFITTIQQSILSYPPQTANGNLSPCSQEEAHTRIFLHAAEALKKGHHNILIRTVDTDVVVLAVSFSDTYRETQVQIWVAYGTDVNFKYIPTHEISKSFSPAVIRSPASLEEERKLPSLHGEAIRKLQRLLWSFQSVLQLSVMYAWPTWNAM